MDDTQYRKRLEQTHGSFFVDMLGKGTDRYIGELFGVEHSKVTRLRKRLGLPPYTEAFPEKHGNKKPRIVITFPDMEELRVLELEDVLPEFKKKFLALKARAILEKP